MSYQPTRKDTAKVMGATLEALLDTEFAVTVNNLKATQTRPEGVFVFVAGMAFDNGEFKVIDTEPEPSP